VDEEYQFPEFDFDQLDVSLRGCLFKVVEITKLGTGDIYHSIQFQRRGDHHSDIVQLEERPLIGTSELLALRVAQRLNEWSFL